MAPSPAETNRELLAPAIPWIAILRARRVGYENSAGPGDHSAVDAEKSDGICKLARLNDQRRKAVEAANDLGKLAEDRLQLFQTHVNRRGFFKSQIARRSVALRGKFDETESRLAESK